MPGSNRAGEEGGDQAHPRLADCAHGVDGEVLHPRNLFYQPIRSWAEETFPEDSGDQGRTTETSTATTVVLPGGKTPMSRLPAQTSPTAEEEVQAASQSTGGGGATEAGRGAGSRRGRTAGGGHGRSEGWRPKGAP